MGLSRGRIDGAGADCVWLGRPVIYHSICGTGWFQTLYAAEPAGWLMLLTTLEFHLLVTLPLGLLGFTVPLLGWLALTSLTLSVAVCVLAAAQAPLSPAKRRWWSRPLVALLFALQPVVRGWARYRERMPWRLRAHRPVDSLEAVALRRGRFRLDRVDLWSEREVDRVAVLHAIMGELEQAGWSVRPDTGWSPYDFEAAAGPWAAVRVVSAIELYPGGRRRLCFRLRPVWSLGARAPGVRYRLGGVTLASASGPARPLSWVWLVGLPGVAAVLLHRPCRRLQSMLAVFLDEFARRRDLVRLPWRSVPRRFRWFQPRKSAPGPLPAPSPPDSPFAIPGPGASSSSKAS